MDKISIPLSNNYKLVVEKNTGEFDKEVYVGIETPDGTYCQDLVIVRPTYKLENDEVLFDADKFEMLIFGDEKREDFTEKVVVPLFKDDE